MAIYRCEIKTFSRSKGQTAIAAAAYRAGLSITNEATGLISDYSRRRGVDLSAIVAPRGSPAWAQDPSKLWQAVENSETRKNSTVAREFLVSLPHELSASQRRELADDLASSLVERFGFAVQYSIHKPDRGSDDRNHHVHILASTRKLEADGFTDKTRELDEIKGGAVPEVREMVAGIVNRHMQAAGLAETVSHLSLLDRQANAASAGDLKQFAEVNRQPTIKEGHGAGLMERHRQNQQITQANTNTASQFVALLETAAQPITHKATPGGNTDKPTANGPFNSSFKGSAAMAAPADTAASAGGSNAAPSSSGGGTSIEAELSAVSSQIADIETQLSLMPAPRTAKDYTRRGELMARKEKLASQMKDIRARKWKPDWLVKSQAPVSMPSLSASPVQIAEQPSKLAYRPPRR